MKRVDCNDNIWDTRYRSGKLQNHPKDSVISFLKKYKPKNHVDQKLNLFELGYGCGANLLFAAEQGFHVYGLETSSVAYNICKQRFKKEAKEACIFFGTIDVLHSISCRYDYIIDNFSSCCASKKEQFEIYKILIDKAKKGSRILFNNYSTEFNYKRKELIQTVIIENTLTDLKKKYGKLSFYSKQDVENIFASECKFLEWDLVSYHNFNSCLVRAPEWHIVAQKL